MREQGLLQGCKLLTGVHFVALPQRLPGVISLRGTTQSPTTSRQLLTEKG